MYSNLDTHPVAESPGATTPPPPPWPPEPTSALRPPRRRPGTAVLVAIAATAVIVAGVAGVTVAMKRPPSREAYAVKADAICAKTNARAAAIPTATTYPQLTSAAGTLAGITREQLAALSRLERPAGSGGLEAGAFLDSLDAGARAAESLQSSPVPTNDFTTVNNTKILQRSFADAGERAGALGMSACVTGMQPGVEAVAGGSHAVVKAAFVAKADALCGAAARQAAAITPADDSLREGARFFQRGAELFSRLWREIGLLPVPPGDEGQVEALRAATEQHLQKLRALRDALASGDLPRAVAADQELEVAVTNVDAKLDAYGLKACGSNFGEL